MKTNIVLILLFNTLFIYSQYTPIPDTIFEQALINQGIDSDGIVNGQVLTSDIACVTNLALQGLEINDLTGIEGFNSLENLNCELNNLSELNLTSNLNLKELKCSNNPLSEIDLSNNTLLEVLHINVTDIKILNLENNPNLLTLQCLVNHSLLSINLINAVNLKNLNLGSSWNLPNVDLSNCINLETLIYDNTFSIATDLNINNNINLKHLYFTGFPFNTINLNNNVKLETLSCPNNSLTSLDLSNNSSLSYLDCGDHNFDYGYFNYITDLDLSNNIDLEILKCNNIGLKNLNIENCINLKELYSYTNPINNLDVSNNILLTKMYCSNNNITSLDLTNNTRIETLQLSNNYGVWGSELPYKNKFVELNLDELVNLKSLNLSRNESINNLHIQNGYNENLSLNTQECHSLYCIYVDNPLSIPTNWLIEQTSNYVLTEEACNSLSSSYNTVIYPNPSNKYFKISSKETIGEVFIYSILGKKIKHFRTYQYKYDIDNIESGLYILIINSEKKLLINKLIIE